MAYRVDLGDGFEAVPFESVCANGAYVDRLNTFVEGYQGPLALLMPNGRTAESESGRPYRYKNLDECRDDVKVLRKYYKPKPKVTHTPGPWKADCFLVVSTKFGGVYGGKPVAHTGGQGNGNEESEANAKLIAAAPEMLEALEAAMSIEVLWAPDRDTDEAEGQALSMMRRAFVSAIAKAKGESVEQA